MAFLAGALLPTAFSPSTYSATFTPKLALLILVGAAGAVPLLRLCRESHVTWAARAALAFLAVALASALLSGSIDVGLFGLYDWGTGWLFWFGCAGAFAFGARLRRDELSWAFAGIVTAGVANALAAIFQVAVQPGGAFALYQGSQADGFLGNPIHLEAVLLGTLVLVASRASLGPGRTRWWPLVLVVSAGLELTLERVAMVLLLVLLAGALVAYGRRRALPFAALTLAGYGAAFLVGGSGLGTRVATGTATTTYGTRFEIWKLALGGLVHHALLGVGPGEAIAVIAPRVSATFAAHLGPSVLPVDSHDFAIEVVVTTGVCGFLAFSAWLGGAAWRARGPFLACAAAMLAVELIEPINVGVTPVALLALGAATVTVGGQPAFVETARRWLRREREGEEAGARPPAPADSPPAPAERGMRSPGGGGAGGVLRPSVLVTSLLVAAALFLGVTMLAGDHYLLVSYDEIPPQHKIVAATDANRLLPYWADSAAAVGEGYLWAANFNGSGRSPLEHAVSWYLTATRRDPADPISRAEIGTIELQLGDRRLAQLQYLHALRLDPWTYEALEGLGTIARDAGDWRTSLYWYERALRVAPVANDLQNLIRGNEVHL